MDFLTAEQVAKRLNFKPQTIYRMAWDGRLPSVKIGRGRRFTEEAVNAFVQSATGKSDKVGEC